MKRNYGNLKIRTNSLYIVYVNKTKLNNTKIILNLNFAYITA